MPNFINTPIDVLGGSICDVLTPILLKIAYADNDFSVEEKETIVNYFTDQWGINPAYIENLISEIGNEFTEFDYVILADSLKELAIESGDIKYDDMVKEIISAAEEVMASDGSIDEREVQEIEKLKLAFITAKPNIKKKLSNAFDTTTTRASNVLTSAGETTATGFNSLKTASSNLASKSSELASSGLGSSMKLASKTGDFAIKKAQSLKGIFSKKTKT
ncbi:MAG TPA: TerB family tellurite resistance protein [Methylococcaceae bacterium]|nr:TerB family tellurite resistance protein [Methylococcaceae bacterium]